jgi:hypothetical protein
MWKSRNLRREHIYIKIFLAGDVGGGVLCIRFFIVYIPWHWVSGQLSSEFFILH